MEHQKFDRLLSTIWMNDIKNINDHLPRSQKYFNELVNEKPPFVNTVSGDKIIFKEADLTSLGKLLDEDEKKSLKLPIILIRRLDLGSGVYSISGGGLEIKVLNKMLAEVGEKYLLDPDHPYLYKPSVYILKRKFGTCIILGFSGISYNEL
ncbi:MAG: DUF61 family protein [Candidatus Odinarchaeum yellowstonii]|uniref:DUF61 family protein n=1 Tax=Odinarchaeota yellowstonii (strain LCB_4) TaxID=1841599 RepID=A0AAF0D349_ODILC|nr:MAG: DUF61 family protein [Candidatus Odinarchaeum yellowstonii]